MSLEEGLKPLKGVDSICGEGRLSLILRIFEWKMSETSGETSNLIRTMKPRWIVYTGEVYNWVFDHYSTSTLVNTRRLFYGLNVTVDEVTVESNTYVVHLSHKDK